MPKMSLKCEHCNYPAEEHCDCGGCYAYISSDKSFDNRYYEVWVCTICRHIHKLQIDGNHSFTYPWVKEDHLNMEE